MKILLLQQDIVWASPETNRKKLSEAVAAAPDADLYIVPEMFSTGFATVPEGIAEEAPSETLEFLRGLAAERDAAFAGSIALHENGSFRNRFFFVKPDGSVTVSDKRHLFTYGGEDRTFTGGDRRTIVEWRGVRFLLLVCYDLRFPVWSRNRGDYDAIIYVASWPEVRRKAWDVLVRARAIENQCFVAAVNRTGDDPSCHYNGGSVFVSPFGDILASCPDSEESAVMAELDMESLQSFRKSFPVLDDADDFELKIK